MDKIADGFNDRIWLLQHQKVSGAGYVDELYPFAKLIPKCVSIGRRRSLVVETLNYKEPCGAGCPPVFHPRTLTRRQVR